MAVEGKAKRAGRYLLEALAILPVALAGALAIWRLPSSLELLAIPLLFVWSMLCARLAAKLLSCSRRPPWQTAIAAFLGGCAIVAAIVLVARASGGWR